MPPDYSQSHQVESHVGRSQSTPLLPYTRQHADHEALHLFATDATVYKLLIIWSREDCTDDLLIVTLREYTAAEFAHMEERYSVLSFHAAASQPKCRIQVHEEKLKGAVLTSSQSERRVNQALYGALRAVQRRKGKVACWCEGLCEIRDQDSIIDLCATINLLPQVLEKAKRLVIWLGPDRDDSDLAMRSIDSIADYREFPHYQSAIGIEAWRAFLSLLQNPWFSRHQSLAELFLSRSIILRYGSRRTTWSKIALTIDSFSNAIDTICHQLLVNTGLYGYHLWTKDAFNKLPAKILVDACDDISRQLQTSPTKWPSTEWIICTLARIQDSGQSYGLFPVLRCLAHEYRSDDALNGLTRPQGVDFDQITKPTSMFIALAQELCLNRKRTDILCYPWAPRLLATYASWMNSPMLDPGSPPKTLEDFMRKTHKSRVFGDKLNESEYAASGNLEAEVCVETSFCYAKMPHKNTVTLKVDTHPEKLQRRDQGTDLVNDGAAPDSTLQTALLGHLRWAIPFDPAGNGIPITVGGLHIGTVFATDTSVSCGYINADIIGRITCNEDAHAKDDKLLQVLTVSCGGIGTGLADEFSQFREEMLAHYEVAHELDIRRSISNPRVGSREKQLLFRMYSTICDRVYMEASANLVDSDRRLQGLRRYTQKKAISSAYCSDATSRASYVAFRALAPATE